jgi:2-haloacid dehalogenase
MILKLDGVRAIVFDVFGTVVDWRTGIAREAGPFLARHGASHIDPFTFADSWRRLYSPAMEAVRSGRRPFTRLDVLHRLDPWPDAVTGLRRLKRRFIIAPLSNGNIRLMLDMAKRAGLPWDAILGAEVTQAYKPTPEAYLRTADILGMRPDEICLVAAHNSDLAAARAVGLKTGFVAICWRNKTGM